jgi:hypothetical protein
LENRDGQENRAGIKLQCPRALRTPSRHRPALASAASTSWASQGIQRPRRGKRRARPADPTVYQDKSFTSSPRRPASFFIKQALNIVGLRARTRQRGKITRTQLRDIATKR